LHKEVTILPQLLFSVLLLIQADENLLNELLKQRLKVQPEVITLPTNKYLSLDDAHHGTSKPSNPTT